MSNLPPRTLNDPVKGMKEIWRQHPEWQNLFSSSWWFFLFLPEQEKGFGPKQAMFAFASRRGDQVAFNDYWAKGIDPDRTLGRKEQFMTTISGWIHDGEEMHDEILFTTSEATLSYDEKQIEAWDKLGHGAQISFPYDPPHQFSLQGTVKGPRGGADFVVWTSGDHFLHNPQIKTVNRKQIFGLGVQYVPWRRFRFKGTFQHPNGQEVLEGYGYFQRVLMNIPMLPWSWCYILFEDGSIFSSFMINIGFQLFNRKDLPMNQFLDRFKYHLKPRGFFYNTETNSSVEFDSCQTIPILEGKEITGFYVEGRMSNGEFIRLKLKPHGHSRFTMKKKFLRNLLTTKYTYNEYMIKVVGFSGSIMNRKVSVKSLGNGWGNVEYTYGISL